MRTIPRSLSFSLVLVFLLCVPALSQENMQLLAPNTGWTLAGQHLYWTTDGGGTWRDVTPPLPFRGARLSSVFFRNSSNGWVLLSGEVPGSPDPRFDLATTNNGGQTWSLAQVDLSSFQIRTGILAPGGSVYFIDSLHGWLNLSVTSSSNFRSGLMFKTDDGGNTWKRPRQDPEIAGHMFFLTPEIGWLAGGPGGERLYVTRDGGGSWQQVSLNAPPQLNAPVYAAIYGLPQFQDDKRAFLPVSYYGGPEELPAALAVFETADGGLTWQLDTFAPGFQAYGVGVMVPSAVVDGALVTASLSARSLTLAVTSLRAGAGATRQVTSTLREGIRLFPPVSELSFISLTEGWLREAALLATSDGGTTWTDISPLRGKGPRLPDAPQPHAPGAAQESTGFALAPSGAAGGPTYPNYASLHMGFDQCQAGTSGKMQTWWTYSPYFDTNVYIGGVNRGCSQPNLSSTWVRKVTGQGWGLIPTWVGPQAPCSDRPFGNQFSSTPSVAATQAVSEANSAASAASKLGLRQTIIYYDMESYTASQCGDAVNAFVDAWVSRLRSNGYLAGVYGNTGDAGDWWSLANRPDDVWIARYDSRATIWGLSHDLPSSAHNIDDTMWTNNQRIHQYYAGPSSVGLTQIFGGVSFTIDQNIEAATVTGGRGTKSFLNFSFTTVEGPTYWQATGVDDMGGDLTASADQIVGPPGFLVTAGILFNPIGCPGGTVPLGTQMGINNRGVIVGSCRSDVDGSYSGFIYSGGTSTTFSFPGLVVGTWANGINDAGQIVGSYKDSLACVHGYVYNYGGDGSFFSFDFPGMGGAPNYVTYLTGINGQGQVVGYHSVYGWPDFGYEGFLWNRSSDGSLVRINYPGYPDTYLLGVNANGQIVGQGGSNFLWSNGISTPFPSPPGSYMSWPVGINNYGRVVGFWTADMNSTHTQGFRAVPTP